MPPLRIPVTRYYGSKRKLVEKIWNIFDELELEFDSIKSREINSDGIIEFKKSLF